MPRFRLSVPVAVGALGAFGCSEGERGCPTCPDTVLQVPRDSIAPQVVSVSPNDGAMDVPVSGQVIVTFSEPAAGATVNDTTFMVTKDGEPLAGSRGVQGSTATFTPASRLAYLTSYTAVVSGVKDTAGNVLQGEYRWSFKTVIWPDTSPPFPRVVFEGVDDDRSGPDATIAAGPSSLVIARNTRIVIRNKVGAIIAASSMADFFASVRPPGANRLTDPQVIFDPQSGRFFFVSADAVYDPACVPGSCVAVILLAVSKSSDPRTLGSGDWFFYALDRTLHKLPEGDVVHADRGDYDHLAVVGRVLVISMVVTDWAETTGHWMVRLLDKMPLINGAVPTTWVDLVDLPQPSLPAITHGDPGVVFLVHAAPCGVTLFGITNPLSSPSVTDLPVEGPEVNPFCPNPPPHAPQPGTPTLIETPRSTLNSQPVYRDGYLWLTRTVRHDFGEGEVAAIQWSEVDVSQWPDVVRVVQRQVFGADRVYNFSPAIMADASRNLAMVYARSSGDEFASLYFTGRLVNDPLNKLRLGKVLKAGVSVYEDIESDGRNRITDYFHAALDPQDGSIWVHGFYAKARNAAGSWVANVVSSP